MMLSVTICRLRAISPAHPIVNSQMWWIHEKAMTNLLMLPCYMHVFADVRLKASFMMRRIMPFTHACCIHAEFDMLLCKAKWAGSCPVLYAVLLLHLA